MSFLIGVCRPVLRRRVVIPAVLTLLLAVPHAAQAQPTLREGSSGPDVRLVQRLLNEQNSAGLTTDGVFGPRTKTAVINYQRRFGLTPDGIVGNNTWNRLILHTGGFSFPLARRPSVDYHTGGRFFGAPRDGRAHAACDLIAAPGTKVLAIADGTITRGPYAFFQNTYAIEVTHPRGYVARYCEIGGTLPNGLRVGSRVTRGQHIATVIRNNDGTAMLHFELYKGTATGGLTQGSNTVYDFVPARAYQRRRDLLNCTYWLDRWPNP